MARDWVWIATEVAEAAHAEQLAEHGGQYSQKDRGVRDAGALDSAMMRARNLALYGEPDWAALAAAYGFGIARNHPFADGNKRTAAVVMETFMVLNGCTLRASDAELVVAIQSLAAGELSEEQLAEWLRDHGTG
jgi:death-on-curing protein